MRTWQPLSAKKNVGAMVSTRNCRRVRRAAGRSVGVVVGRAGASFTASHSSGTLGE